MENLKALLLVIFAILMMYAISINMFFPFLALSALVLFFIFKIITNSIGDIDLDKLEKEVDDAEEKTEKSSIQKNNLQPTHRSTYRSRNSNSRQNIVSLKSTSDATDYKDQTYFEDIIYEIDEEVNLKSESNQILEQYRISYVYHMTHFKNLENIIQFGLFAHDNNYVVRNIDNVEVNKRRNKTDPINEVNLHSYVPFYFNPKNPMLHANIAKQDEIIILVFDKKLLTRNKTLFTDGNAASQATKFYSNLKDLKNLSWDCINANYWSDFDDGKRKRMSEVLVPKKVKIKHLQKIYCYNSYMRAKTKLHIFKFGNTGDIDIVEKKEFYF